MESKVKMTKIAEKKMELNMLQIQIQNLPIPNIAANIPFLNAFFNHVDDQTISNVLGQMPLEKLKALQTNLNTIGDVDKRFTFINKYICEEVYDRSRAMEEYLKVIDKSCKTLTVISLWKAFMLENGSMSWDAYRAVLEHHIDEHNQRLGAQKAANGDLDLFKHICCNTPGGVSVVFVVNTPNGVSAIPLMEYRQYP